jgi:D-alanyl-D-alanine carboxypeptidase
VFGSSALAFSHSPISGVSPRATGRDSRPRGPAPGAGAQARGGRSASNSSGRELGGREGAAADIPLARRSRPPAGSQPSLASRFRWGLLGSLVVGSLAVALLLGPLRPWLLPLPVAGLNARLAADGRLLGHFPYPEAPAASLVTFAPGLALREEAARELLEMQRAAAADGVQLTVISAFRSQALQRHLFFEVGAERKQSPEERAQVSAPPGFSEHSTGFAVDLADGRNPQTNLSTSFETTDAYAWLQANAVRFHFLLSFPANNRQGVNYEPWHWRFEGSTEALRLFEPAHRLSRTLP